MKRKITLYTISKCPITSSNDEFIEHMCTIVSNKKHIQEYIINKSIIENWQHYVSWLELHDKSDNWESKCDYMTICLGWEETFSKYSVKKQVYNQDGIAAMLRVLYRCLPTGSSYETETELNVMTTYLNEVAEKLKKGVDSPLES